MNYVGSLGYYGWHFAWVLLVIQVFVEASRYFVVGQRIEMEVMNAGGQQSTNALTDVTIIGLVLVALLLLVCVVILPYYLGKLSRRLPRAVLSETSWPQALQSILRVKQLACLGVVIAAIVCIFVPEGVIGTNLGFFVVLGSALSASVCFAVQHKLATLWRIPERYVF